MSERADVVVVGAGAAGLATAIFSARRLGPGRVLLLDSARRPGAKILVSGGGRCNVTHFEVQASDFAGSSRYAITKVLRELTVPATVEFFRGIPVLLLDDNNTKGLDPTLAALDAHPQVEVRLFNPFMQRAPRPIPKD